MSIIHFYNSEIIRSNLNNLNKSIFLTTKNRMIHNKCAVNKVGFQNKSVSPRYTF